MKSTDKKVIVIGAGVAGLSAGAYLRMNGYDVEILEKHAISGGLCTGWRRGDYIIDGCIHWVVGTGSSSYLHHLWAELIDFHRISIVYHDVFLRVEDEDGNGIDVYTDLDKLEHELITKAPEDTALIKQFVRWIRKLKKFKLNPDPPELLTVWDKIRDMVRMLPQMPALATCGRKTIRSFAETFRNPLLRRTMESLFVSDMSLLFMVLNLGWMSELEAGYPVGGSLEFIRHLEERFLHLGGILRHRSEVDRILVEDGKANGVRLADGTEIAATTVVSAADLHGTLNNLLGGVDDPEFKACFRDLKPFPSMIYLGFGIKRDMTGLPHALSLPINLDLGDGTVAGNVHVRIHHFDHTLAPPGCTVVTASFITDRAEHWSLLCSGDPDRYHEAKERIKDAVVDLLESRFGDIRSHIEVADVATPATFERYTANWNGSFEGWLLDPDSYRKNISHQVKGFKNVYLAGHWIHPGGGISNAMCSGRQVAQMICDRDGQKFETTQADANA